MPSGPIQVDGPGPIEPRASSTAATAAVASLPAGGSSSELINTNPTEEDHDDGQDHQGGEDDDDYVASPSGPADPYANLEGAFGGYMADEPRPQRNDLDGLF